jgi:lantibiotic modifying enzyme
VGVGLFLVDAFLVSRRERYLEAAAFTAEWGLCTLERRRRRGQREFVPNLYFGDAGLIWLLLKLALASGEDHFLNAALELSRTMAAQPYTVPDLMHGTAGRGLVHLALALLTEEQQEWEAALAAGDLLRRQATPGQAGLLWVFPEDIPEFAGKAFYGTHGNAGIGYFLLALGVFRDEKEFLELGHQAFVELLAVACPTLPDGRGLNWPNGPDDERALIYWCNGAPGIGTFFAHAYKLTPHPCPEYLQAARRAAYTTAEASFGLPLVQCHGLAGNGELLLDVYRLTREPLFYEQALRFGELIATYGYEKEEEERVLLWAGEDGLSETPAYMTGYSGIAAYLLRLAYPKLPRPLTIEHLWGERR